MLKGVRLGYLPKRMAAWAEKAFYGTCDRYLSKNPDGSLQLDGICLVAGLGGKDHRDGSLAYYFSEPVVCNDAKDTAGLSSCKKAAAQPFCVSFLPPCINCPPLSHTKPRKVPVHKTNRWE